VGRASTQYSALTTQYYSSGSGSPSIEARWCRNFPLIKSAGSSVIEARQLSAMPTTEEMPSEPTPG